MRRFFLVFFITIVALFGVETTTPVQDAIIIPFTAHIAAVSAWLLQLFDGSVHARGIIIWDAVSGFSVMIEEGCNGVEASLVLIAAMIAYPASWRQRLVGIAIGIATIQVLNIIRIVTLFYLGQWNAEAFEWAHLYVWQALIMLDVLLFFLLWLRWISRHGRAPTNEAALAR